MNYKNNKGVLDNEYSEERKKKPELIFRYKTRARMVSNIIKNYHKNSRNLEILELGAAEGLLMVELDKIIKNNNISGLEYSKKLIGSAPPMPKNLTLFEGDATKFPDKIKSKKYDVVCALALLEHLSKPKNCLKESLSILEPGGIFIASSPNPLWDSVSVKLGLLKGGQHEIDMTKNKMISMPQAAGFEILKFERFMWAPVSILPYFKIKISPKTSLAIDSIISKFYLFNWLFVNQLVVARKK